MSVVALCALEPRVQSTQLRRFAELIVGPALVQTTTLVDPCAVENSLGPVVEAGPLSLDFFYDLVQVNTDTLLSQRVEVSLGKHLEKVILRKIEQFHI